jgi:hypothetical protein
MPMDESQRDAPNRHAEPTKSAQPTVPPLKAARPTAGIEQTAEEVLAGATQARAESWIERNRAAMDSWNDYVDRYGLPLQDLQPL